MQSAKITLTMADEAGPRLGFAERNRTLLLGLLSVALFLAAWQAVFLFVPFNPLFISKPTLIAAALAEMIVNGDLFHDLAVSAVPFVYGFSAAVVVGVTVGIVMGWRPRVSYALDPLMIVFYASPLVALAPLVIVFFGVGVSGKAIIIFLLSVFPFIFNAQAGVKAGLKNDIGTVAMARTSDPHSASAQFFINVNNNTFLNWGDPRSDGNDYAVFGKVVSGMDVVNKIAKAATGNSGMHQNVPRQAIVIEAATVVGK